MELGLRRRENLEGEKLSSKADKKMKTYQKFQTICLHSTLNSKM